MGQVERLVDKLSAGAERLLPLTAVSLLLSHRRLLLGAGDAAATRALLHRLPEEDSDRVCNLALELWARLNKV